MACMVSLGYGCHKLGDFINQDTIHEILHQAEKMMIETLHLNLRFCVMSYNGIDYMSML